MIKRPTVQAADPITNKALLAVRNSIPDTTAVDGLRQLDDITLVSGVTKRIAHGLKRKLRGYVVVRCNTGSAFGYIYDEQSSHPDTDVYLYLRAEGYSPTVSLLLF